MKPRSVLMRGIAEPSTTWTDARFGALVSGQFDSLIWAMAGADGARAALIKGVIAHESEWVAGSENPRDPSVGLMAVMWGAKGPYPSMSKADVWEPSTNITLGSRYLLSLLARFGNVEEAVSAYNGGYRNSTIGNWPYVTDVLDNQQWYLDNDPMILRYTGGDDVSASPDFSGGSDFTPNPDVPGIPGSDDDSGGDYTPTEIGVGVGALMFVGALVLYAIVKT